MRNIEYIVLHCTATSQNAKVESIQRYWKQTLKWRNPGYHYIIDKDGLIYNLLPIDAIANGVKGHNYNSIHISYIGGIDKQGKAYDNRTPKQVISQLELIDELKEQFPDAKIVGHRDFKGVAKDCPSFEVQEWLKHVGYKEEIHL
ncbi:N-acetylmuramoyl-L-alanine amidase [Joostella sp. CR20]|uniref:N-acetylmuramoyl-L-alanine amidase n=1 Tax=Joostella sp. CR20 TaxID=2804312 RepID=UPI00313B55BA